MDYIIKQIDKNNLDMIKPLWEKVNQIHYTDSHYFKEHYKNFTFEKRCIKFTAIDNHNIRIDVVYDDTQPIGYCIATIEGKKGEIDSIFIEEKYRNRNLGTMLRNNCIDWLRKRDCETIVVSIVEGHESVMPFYMKLGFHPRLWYLQLKNTDQL